ncbi:MAG: M28 family peptidase [Nannocystaceae bacterium]
MKLVRTLGDPRRAAAAEQLASMVVQQTHSPPRLRRQNVEGSDPKTGQRFQLTNLVFDYRPQAPRAFILATHYDTRPWAEEDPNPQRREQPLPGANDGTSGLAVLIELAPLLDAQLPSDVGFTIIAFDGEELGRPGYGGYCVGSRALAQAIETGAFQDLAQAQFGIVLDMVGGIEMTLPKEPGSLRNHAKLVDDVWQTAQARELPSFAPHVHHQAIYDDHTPLTEAGIPSILLIDHDYAHWHTHADTLDKISASSLGSVGEALRAYLIARYN